MVEQFVVNPMEAANRTIGEHQIKFPAASICDPATSTYGIGEWDAPCQPLKTPITTLSPGGKTLRAVNQ